MVLVSSILGMVQVSVMNGESGWTGAGRKKRREQPGKAENRSIARAPSLRHPRASGLSPSASLVVPGQDTR